MRHCLATLALVLLFAVRALAHDSWINDGRYRSPAGELCCGEGDCAVMDSGAVASKAYGYVIYGHGTIISKGVQARVFIDEIVPLAEALPSPDGAFWRCQRADKSRRCFFAPPPSQ